MPMNCMFDTNIFNNILDKSVCLESLKKNVKCHATHIQQDEILKTKDEDRKNELKRIFESLSDETVSTSSFAFGISRFYAAKVGNGALYKAIFEALSKTPGSKEQNNRKDALIAEAAINNGFVLVTHDAALFKAVTDKQGSVVNLYYVVNPAA